MTAFVILAAGPGTRMGRAGDTLHKALVPLDSRAVISHQIGLAPPDARVIVCTGFRAGQVAGYLELAHPDREIITREVPGWDEPGGGPGASLLAAHDAAGDDDLVFTSCDTLWKQDSSLWETGESWAGVAPVPAGTSPERWCRMISWLDGQVLEIHDKVPSSPPGDVYTGLARIARRDLAVFWAGIADPALHGTELQVTGGLEALVRRGLLRARRIGWTDIGDEAAYARAVAARTGYDWAKPGEVTWVLPEHGRVVKYRASAGLIGQRARRQESIAGAVPKLAAVRPGMLAYEYVPGVTAYETAEHDPGLVPRLLDWAQQQLWHPVRADDLDTEAACDQFYRVKTGGRIMMLRPGLRGMAQQAAARTDWAELARGCLPVTFHGDFNFGNIIVRPGGGFTAVDWREDFAGQVTWGDWQYDIAKLAAGMIVHWGNARRGDFRPWPGGRRHLDALRDRYGEKPLHGILVLAGLSLLNCAPLHAPPLDEILVARGATLLEELS